MLDSEYLIKSENSDQSWFNFFKKYWWAGVIGVVGVAILGYGLYVAVIPSKPMVELVKQNQSSEHSLAQGSELGGIRVDVSGAVEKPGVYKLPTNARVGDAIVVAGGLSATADRGWVSRYVNLASEVKDGAKIYIPENQQTSGVGKSVGQVAGESVNKQAGKININTASEKELDSLPGIGEVRAGAIIASRPYGSIDELVAKAKIPQSTFDQLKDLISVY